MSDIFINTTPVSAEARPMFEAIAAEYQARYNAESSPRSAEAELLRYPPEAFAPPLGDFIVLRRDGETIAGGAFMSHDDETAEFKRIWTRSDLRRQGLARRIMQVLEERAAELGYTRAYLTTGYRQPEAVALYLSLGYRPLFDTAVDPQFYRSLPFEKPIGARAGQSGTSPIRPPAATFEEATAIVNAIKAEQAEKIAARLAARTEAAE